MVGSMSSDTPASERRPLFPVEQELATWMLTHGNPEAQAFLPHVHRAVVVGGCPCGCASIDFEVTDLPAPSGGLRVLGDYVFGEDMNLAGAFIFERAGVLAGIEVYGLAGEAPRTLPRPEELRPFPSPASGA